MTAYDADVIVPVSDPVNEPLNEPVLTCADEVTQPGYCAELLTVPAGNCVDDEIIPEGILVNPEYGNVPVCDPVNDPVNGEVKLLNCNDDDTVPVGNELTTCVELLIVPAGNAVEFNA